MYHLQTRDHVHISKAEMHSSDQNNYNDSFAKSSSKSSSWSESLTACSRITRLIAIEPKVSIASPAWEHRLSQKHLAKAPSDSDSTRYFDRSRQTRRVFIDGLIVWSATAIVCVGIFGTMYYYSSRNSITQSQKYEYNMIMIGFSILLGLTFAAQFKQYCEFMRWRFLASMYRSVTEFDDVLGCDSWRTTLKLIFRRHGKAGILPTKSQVLAFIWLLMFISFNLLVALIGLTYSVDVSDSFKNTAPGRTEMPK
jgi:hypothetical protein